VVEREGTTAVHMQGNPVEAEEERKWKGRDRSYM
jgi:hypothetical protein